MQHAVEGSDTKPFTGTSHWLAVHAGDEIILYLNVIVKVKVTCNINTLQLNVLGCILIME